MSRFRQGSIDPSPAPAGKNSKYALYAVALIVLIAFGVFVYLKIRTGSNAEDIAKQDIDPAIEQVSKIFEAPSGEVPTIEDASVLLSKLADRSILPGAQDTDKVLLYQNSKILLVYRPSTKKIVTIVPLNTPAQPQASNESTGEQSAQGSSTPQSSEVVTIPLNIEVRNGTNESGAAGVLAKRLETEAGAKTVKTGNAANKDYKASVLVNLSGKDVSKLEASLGVKAVTELPTGEKASSADALVIYGK